MTTTLSLHSANGTPVFLLGGDVPSRIDQVFGSTLIKGRWFFPAFRPVHDRVVEDLRKVAKNLVLDPKVKDHLREMTSRLELPEDFTFITKPFAHQLEGLLWAYNNPRSGLFYDPGLGKCKITIDLHRLTGARMLVLCPKVVLRTWAREFKLHGEITDVIVVEGSGKKKLEAVQAAQKRMPAALIITYESAVALASELSRVPYTCIVLDESHRIKSISSVRTKAALMLSEKASRRLLLSGTPTLGSPFSLYPQLRLLGQYFAPENWVEYKKAFGHFPPDELRAGKPQRCLGYKNLDGLNKRVNEVCLRKYLQECVDLPERQIIDVPFEVLGEQRTAYNHLIREKADAVGLDYAYRRATGKLTMADGPRMSDPYVWAAEPVTLLNKLEQVTGGFLNQTYDNPGYCNGCPHLESCLEAQIRPFTKFCRVEKTTTSHVKVFPHNNRAEALSDLLEDLLENPDNKVIVWTRFLQELADVGSVLERLGVEYVSVQGGMTTEAFEGAMNTFNTNPNCRVYAGQVASGIGVTLNAANYTIYYSLPWSLEHYQQSMARNYRIGQGRKVTVYRLLAQGTVDEAKAEALDQKVDIDTALTDASYTPYCAKHVLNLPDQNCTCDGSIMRIVAKLKTLA